MQLKVQICEIPRAMRETCLEELKHESASARLKAKGLGFTLSSPGESSRYVRGSKELHAKDVRDLAGHCRGPNC